MKDKFLNKVKVAKEFPGFDEGDVLILNPSNGLFEFSHNETSLSILKNTALDTAFSAIAEYKPSLSKKSILKFITYFDDQSYYEMKDKEWVLNRIEELKAYIRELEKDVEDDVISFDVDVKESKTVWQNIIWEYETLLGMRKLIS